MMNTSKKSWIAKPTAAAEDTNREAEILGHLLDVALPSDSSLPTQAVAQGAKGLNRGPCGSGARSSGLRYQTHF